MKRWISIVGCVVIALAFFVGAATRAEAHEVPVHEGGGASLSPHPNPFVTSLTPMSRLKATAVSAVSCTNGFVLAFPCKNVDLAAWLDTTVLGGAGTGSDIWGWTDPSTKKEYAILNHAEATAFVDVTNPDVPVVQGTLPAPFPGAVWRESKVYNNHVYIVQDVIGAGLQIFDLTRLRTAVPGVVFTADAVYRGPTSGRGSGIDTVHTITINEKTGFAYLNGSDPSQCSAGPVMLDLKPNPKVPVFVGCFSSDGYTHDAQCVVYDVGPDTAHRGKEICALYNEDTLTIVDVTDKSAPVQLSRTHYDGSIARTNAYTHQGWFTEDQVYILMDDEYDETRGNNGGVTTTYLWNAADLDAPALITEYRHKDEAGNPKRCIDHNQYVKGKFVYQSNYACGLRIHDVSQVAEGKLNEVAYFDTVPDTDFTPASSGGDLQGDWSNYPYFASGNVVVNNIRSGLFVLKPRLTPTAVNVLSFRGRSAGRGVTLTWRTGAELDTVGFHVWRYGGGGGVKVNRSLVPAKSVGRPEGAKYSLVDRSARPGARYTYKLQVVSADGRRAWQASASVRVRRG